MMTDSSNSAGLKIIKQEIGTPTSPPSAPSQHHQHVIGKNVKLGEFWCRSFRFFLLPFSTFQNSLSACDQSSATATLLSSPSGIRKSPPPPSPSHREELDIAIRNNPTATTACDADGVWLKQGSHGIDGTRWSPPTAAAATGSVHGVR